MPDRSVLLEFRLPDLGEGLTDAELVSWHVAVGDHVDLNQTIAEVETAKAQVELPSPFVGTVTELLAQPGDTVPVGSVLIRITADVELGVLLGEGVVPEEPPFEGRSTISPVASQEAVGPVLVGYGPGDTAQTRRHRPTPAPLPSATAIRPTDFHRPDDLHRTAEAGRRTDAKPSARKLARELGVELSEVPGTGMAGAVTQADVYAFHHASRPDITPQREVDQSPAPAAAEARETRVKATGVRKRTAEAMTVTARSIPAVTEFLTVDATATMDLLAHLRKTPSFAEIKLTPLALVSKIVLAALAEHPEINASWNADTGEIITKHYVNLGIAVATERGLLVPNVKEAQRMNLRELCREINWLTESAREAGTTPVDLTGGTFTITNVGVFGVDAGTPIINPGEAAILCLGTVAKRPWVVNDAVVPRMVTTLALSFDHRLIDGEQGSKFLATIGAMIEDPLTLLAT